MAGTVIFSLAAATEKLIAFSPAGPARLSHGPERSSFAALQH
jgi:hypothetical protein